jgi:hypothetical protein
MEGFSKYSMRPIDDGRETRKRRICGLPDTANQLAEEMHPKGRALLAGGHAYATVFSGGADQARYCSETMNLASLAQAVNPFRLVLLALRDTGKFLRIIGHSLVETVLTLKDFFTGLFKVHDLAKEIKFIPARVIVCIVLRELVRFRMKRATKQGVPVVCGNFLGYDEQAHRRGPSSAYAHWSLKDIDGVILDGNGFVQIPLPGFFVFPRG